MLLHRPCTNSTCDASSTEIGGAVRTSVPYRPVRRTGTVPSTSGSKFHRWREKRARGFINLLQVTYVTILMPERRLLEYQSK